MTTLQRIHDLDTFVATRDALHRVAEHVVAKARYLDDREIRLSAYPGGFATPLLGDGRRVRVDVDEIVVDDTAPEATVASRRRKLTTIADAATFVGVEPGFPTELYNPATDMRADKQLKLDHDAAQALADWYDFTAAVLGAFASELANGSGHANPSPLILWPEHFDQAFYTEDEAETRRANYGASPGDEGHPEPYLYVGPWGTVVPDAFWNAAHFTGAVLSISDLAGAADAHHTALQFLRTGRGLLV